MRFCGARVAQGPAEAIECDLRIPGPDRTIDLGGYMILPGLINAHDHLEFNLYPRLGRGPYANAGEWARDVYHPDRSPIREQRKISKSTRLVWGGLKNLLCGVTTVFHHNPMGFKIFDRNFPVRVIKQFGWAHSLEFTKDLAEIFRATPAEFPFVVHLGEGTDEQSRNEIFRLNEMGALDARTILVHAVALDARGLDLVREKGASLVWCPSSNHFLLGRTLRKGALQAGIPIALGSDSALTAAGDLLDELQVARACGRDTDELYRMVTEIPAGMLRLPATEDRAVFRDKGGKPSETLLSGDPPEMVIIKGKIKLIAPHLAERMKPLPAHYARLKLEGRPEVQVAADIANLYNQAQRVLGEVRLSGRRVHQI